METEPRTAGLTSSPPTAPALLVAVKRQLQVDGWPGESSKRGCYSLRENRERKLCKRPKREQAKKTLQKTGMGGEAVGSESSSSARTQTPLLPRTQWSPSYGDDKLIKHCFLQHIFNNFPSSFRSELKCFSFPLAKKCQYLSTFIFL